MTIAPRAQLSLVANALSELGKTPSSVAIALAVIAVRQDLGLWLLALLIFSEVANRLLKSIFQRQRPSGSATDRLEGLYAFPSAHAQNAAVLWGMLAGHASSVIVSLLCLAMIAGIGWSRLHIKAHHRTDVIAGWIIGAAIAVAGLVILNGG